LTLIFRMGQRACHFLSCIELRPIRHLWSSASNYDLDFPWNKSNNDWHAIDYNVQDRVGTMSLVFGDKGSWFIQKGQWRTKVNILRFVVAYLNGTINRKTWNTKPAIRTDWSNQTRQNPCVDGYGSGIGLLRPSWSVFGQLPDWTELILRSESGLLAGYPDSVLSQILVVNDRSYV